MKTYIPIRAVGAELYNQQQFSWRQGWARSLSET